MTSLELDSDLKEKHVHDSLGFDYFSEAVQENFRMVSEFGGGQLFHTDTTTLWSRYLDALPDGERAVHDCHVCRQFIERFGGLVAIDAEGITVPALWPERAPAPYANASQALRRAVAKQTVTGVFYSADRQLGTAVTGPWTHFAVPNPKRHTSKLETPEQAAALKKEHFRTLSVALNEFKAPLVNEVLKIIQSEALQGDEKITAPANFLANTHAAIAEAKGREAQRNVIWRAIATAPAGWCTPRSTVLGSVLEDLKKGLAFGVVARKFREKVNGVTYQRAQVAPTEGNIKRAEEIFTKLGLAASLKRRFAYLEEIQTIWKPAPARAEETKDAGGLFSDLTPKSGPKKVTPIVETPPVAITFEKFCKKVLPEALEIEVKMSPTVNLGAFVTAIEPDAPPILQWDSEEDRIPVSWYIYNGGSSPHDWGSSAGSWVRATAVALQPSQWRDPEGFSHLGKHAMILLEGIYDKRIRELALFPSTLRSELHEVRSTIERHSKTRKLENNTEATACGLMLPTGFGTNIRVKTKLGHNTYQISAWD